MFKLLLVRYGIFLVLLTHVCPPITLPASEIKVSVPPTPEIMQRGSAAPTVQSQTLDAGPWYPDVTVWDAWMARQASLCDGTASWYGSAQMLALFRDGGAGRSVATIGPVGPAVLSTSDVPNRAAAGARVLVGHQFSDRNRLEVSYFGSYSWNGSAAVDNLDPNSQGGIGNLYSSLSGFGDPAGILGVDFNQFASVRVESRLTNGEINLMRRVLFSPGNYATWFVLGGRYIDARDRLRHYTESDTPGPGRSSNDLQLHASNRMVGLQLGVSNRFDLECHTWISFDMMGGLFHNRASVDRAYAITGADGSHSDFGGADSTAAASLLGELSLQLHYELTRSWTLFAGYQATWITGQALAENNFPGDEVVLVFGPTRVVHDRTAVYHGPSFGLLFVW